MTIYEQQNLPDWCLYQANNEYHGAEHHFSMLLSTRRWYGKRKE